MKKVQGNKTFDFEDIPHEGLAVFPKLALLFIQLTPTWGFLSRFPPLADYIEQTKGKCTVWSIKGGNKICATSERPDDIVGNFL